MSATTLRRKKFAVAGGGNSALTTVVFLAAYVVGLFMPAFYLSSMSTVWIFGMMAIGAVPVIRDLGLPSLGQGVFVGLAAYTVGLLIAHGVVAAEVATVAAIALAIVASLAVGGVLLRTAAPYFMIATLALGQLLSGVASSLTDFAGGDNGLVGLPAEVFGVDMADPASSYYATLTLLLVAFVGVAWLRSTRLGYRIRSLRKHQGLAGTLGVAPIKTKLTAFAVGAASSAVGGVLLAFQNGYAHPSMLGIATSGVVFLIVAVPSGMSPVGVVLAAVLIEGTNVVGGSYTDHSATVLGGIVLVVYGVTSWPPARAAAARISGRLRRHGGKEPNFSAARAPIDEVLVTAGAPSTLRREQRTSHPGHAALEARSLQVAFGGVEVLRDVDLVLEPADRLGVIGPNGAGKTTLVNVLTGATRSGGEVSLSGRGITGSPTHKRARRGLARTFQVASPVEDWTVQENLAFASAMRHESLVRRGALLRRVSSVEARTREIAAKWGLTEYLLQRVGSLPYGVRRVVELAMATSGQPRVLLLDEPEAGLSSEQGRDLVRMISASLPDTAILLVEHDVDTVFEFARHVIVLDHGVVIARGTPDEIRVDPAVREAYLGLGLAGSGQGASNG